MTKLALAIWLHFAAFGMLLFLNSYTCTWLTLDGALNQPWEYQAKAWCNQALLRISASWFPSPPYLGLTLPPSPPALTSKKVPGGLAFQSWNFTWLSWLHDWIWLFPVPKHILETFTILQDYPQSLLSAILNCAFSLHKTIYRPHTWPDIHTVLHSEKDCAKPWKALAFGPCPWPRDTWLKKLQTRANCSKSALKSTEIEWSQNSSPCFCCKTRQHHGDVVLIHRHLLSQAYDFNLARRKLMSKLFLT